MSRMSVRAAIALLAVVAVAVGAAGPVLAETLARDDGDATHPAVGQSADAGTPYTLDGELRAVASVSNTSNYLSPGATDRRSYVGTDVDVSAAAGMSAQRLHARHDRGVFDTRYEAGSDRVGLVRETADTVQARLDRLDARHDALLTAYSNGSITRDAMARRLARLAVAAETTRDHLAHVNQRVDDDSETSVPVPLETRLSDLQTVLVTLPNPVTDRIEAGLTGQRDPAVVYMGGDDDGLVVATVDDGDFVRTATVRGDYAPDQPDQFEQTQDRDVIAALQRGGELYPWAYENDIGGPQIRGFGNTDVYRIRVDYGHGTLQTYLSGGTTNAFHEIQIQDPEGVPITDTTSRATESINVTVETTTDSGPMRVRLIQPATNAPLDGTIRVDGEVVGATGDDGTLWTTQPPGQFRVNATTGANTAEVTVIG